MEHGKFNIGHILIWKDTPNTINSFSVGGGTQRLSKPFLPGFGLAWSYAGNHSSCAQLSETVMTCPEKVFHRIPAHNPDPTFLFLLQYS